MNKLPMLLEFAVTVACAMTLFRAEPALAAGQRSFVASIGNDATTCTLTEPCRSFAAAVANTNAEGEVIVIDAAGYGPVTITKSISIVAPPGIYAGIAVSSNVDGITINVPASDRIVLRGLTINGQSGNSATGINVVAGGDISIESCDVSNLSAGIRMDGGSHVRVSGSTIRSNADGIIARNHTITVDDTAFSRNGVGMMLFDGGIVATIRNSRFTDSVTHGLDLELTLSSSKVSVSHSEFSLNGGVGILISASGSGTHVDVALDSISVHGNGSNGVQILGGGSTAASVSIAASQMTFNAGDGVRVASFSSANVTLSQSAVSNNGAAGVVAIGASSVDVRLNGNTIAQNFDNDIDQVAPAVVRTFGNNALTTGSVTNISGSLVPAAMR